MKIVIETVAQSEQRYDTLGDWEIEPDGTIHIKVTKSGEEPLDFLVGLHELIEVWLCRTRGVTQKMVDDFDMVIFPTVKSDDPQAEPGDHPLAPYRREHRFAAIVEHLVAHELGLRGYGTVR